MPRILRESAKVVLYSGIDSDLLSVSASNPVENCCHRWPIGWTRSDMMQANDSAGVDEYIAAQLVVVPAGLLKTPSLHEKLCVNQPRSWAVNGPPAAAFHSISHIEGPGLIDKHGPRKIGLANVGLRRGPEFESDDDYSDAQCCEFIVMLTQLRQVFASG